MLSVLATPLIRLWNQAAPALETVFDGRPRRTITVTQGDLDEMRAAEPERSEIVVFGCPQLTLDEALHLASRLSGAQASRFLEDAGGPEGRANHRYLSPSVRKGDTATLRLPPCKSQS